MPLLRTEPDWGSDDYASLHTRYQQLVAAELARAMRDLRISKSLSGREITSISLGGSSALGSNQRPAHDLDLYLWGYEKPHEHDRYQNRQRAVEAWVRKAVSGIAGASIEYIYTQSLDQPPYGLQKIMIKIPVPEHAQQGGVRAVIVKLEVHHECEKNFLPVIPACSQHPLPRIDERMVMAQKLSRAIKPDGGLKPVDLWDLHFFVEQFKGTDHAPDLFRKLAIAGFACEGDLRKPITLDWLQDADDTQISAVLEGMEKNIPPSAIRQHLGSNTHAQLATLRVWVKAVQSFLRDTFPRKEGADIGKPAMIEDLVALSDGEQIFLTALLKGRLLAGRVTQTSIEAQALMEGIPADVAAEIVPRILSDNGILHQQEMTSRRASAAHEGQRGVG